MNGPPHDYVGEALGSAAWHSESFTAKELQSMRFSPISWIVPNIIPAEGVTLLCSKPKFGKSWFAYDLCISCTMERFTFGTIKPAQGGVLYLALEDSKRRLHGRMSKLLSTGVMWPEALTLKTEWRRLHEGGVDDIRAWHTHTKSKGGKPILVVIDVLAKVRKPVGNRQLYEADYAALADLTKLANELGLAIVVVHHTRKMASDDPMETVSGSYGVSGAADTILVMATKGSGTVLDIRGRDVESAELAIEFNKKTCRWRVLGHAAEVHVSEQRAKILAALKEAGQPMTIAALAEAIGSKRNPLEVLLGRMARDAKSSGWRKGFMPTGTIPRPRMTPHSARKNGASLADLSHLSGTQWRGQMARQIHVRGNMFKVKNKAAASVRLTHLSTKMQIRTVPLHLCLHRQIGQTDRWAPKPLIDRLSSARPICLAICPGITTRQMTDGRTMTSPTFPTSLGVRPSR